MERFSTIFDAEGIVVFDKWVEYKRKRDRNDDDDDEEEEKEEKAVVLKEKRPYAPRNYHGYDPNRAVESEWYRRYVSEVGWFKNKTHFKQFRRRFRTPFIEFKGLVVLAREQEWFPTYEKFNACGQPGIPLELFILGSLRYLGRGWTFDDIAEATGVSEESHRTFFSLFVKACRKFLYPMWVKRPETVSEVKDHMSEFKAAAFDGCIGSADVTHIIMEKCHARLKNQNLGGKDSHTTRAYQLVVNHRRQILASTIGFPGRWNDTTIVRFDDFITDIQRGNYLADNVFSLYNEKGEVKLYKGAWILVDGGYPSWTSLICPFKETSSIRELRWSRWAESMRKDVECTFGIMKGKIHIRCYTLTTLYIYNCYLYITGRWRILKTGVRLHGLQIVDDIWFTCCAFHNMLLNCDGLDRKWNKGVNSPFEGELGWHAPGDTEAYCDPIIFQRFRSGRQGNNPRLFDSSVLGSTEPNRINQHDEDDNENDDGVQEAKSLSTLSNLKFRNILVTHFNKLWELGKLIWPSRTGKMAIG